VGLRGARKRQRVALVEGVGAEMAPIVGERSAAQGLGAGFSQLRVSVPARLAMMAGVAALLWGAVFWALT
jgi:hypothetical protein